MNKIYGRRPVLEALNAGVDIDVIYIAYNQHGDTIHKIFTSAKEKGIKVTQISQQRINELAHSENAQGVVAIKSAAKFFELHELIEHSKKSTYPLLLLLDSIQDPHNLGAILRTAECAGVDGVVVTINQSSPITETVEKISAGAVSYLKICKVNNMVRVIELLKKNNFWIIGSSLVNSKDYTSLDYKMPVALVMGNEEKGIRKLVSESCDFLVNVPMHGKIDSLNVSVAAGVLLFGILRQRNA
jgi:23S rRNA (guanosine2251-2'-O)-methyltransferase